MSTRARVLVSLLLVEIMVLGTAAFVQWALGSPPEVQVILLRVVMVSLLIFLAILFLRYFTLLWFAYLQHVERTVSKRPDSKALPPISVLVPAYNEAAVIEGALASLATLDYPEAAWEGQHGNGDFRVVTKRNGGKAAALNTGIALSKHPYVFCMDADSRLEPQVLKRSVMAMEDPSVGAVAGNVKVENRSHLITQLQALEYIEGLNMPRRAQGFIAAVNIVPGPVGLFRREALEEVGCYDTDTFAEDADLTLKLVGAGWKVVYEDTAVAWTEAPESWRDLVQQRYRWTRGILQSLKKRKAMFLRPFPDFPLWLSAAEMAFEAIAWPILNVYAHLFFALVAVLFGAGELLLYWWILLTLLDLVAALLTVSMERESLVLIPFALIYRFFFILFLDVVKTFAALEELFNLGMGWEKVQRTAATQPSV
jgi:cellulose synthase/poly-beta-1,6-N-acetylglucosamine synthase-like glycosyltransferase